jgi:hypothetical protein
MPAKIVSASVGYADWMLLGSCAGTTAPSFARRIAVDQEPMSLPIKLIITVYLPRKKVFLLFADLRRNKRSKTLERAFPERCCCLQSGLLVSQGERELRRRVRPNVVSNHGRW